MFDKKMEILPSAEDPLSGAGDSTEIIEKPARPDRELSTDIAREVYDAIDRLHVAEGKLEGMIVGMKDGARGVSRAIEEILFEIDAAIGGSPSLRLRVDLDGLFAAHKQLSKAVAEKDVLAAERALTSLKSMSNVR